MEKQYRPQHLTEQHYEHRLYMRPLLQQQQQQKVSIPTGEITTKEHVSITEQGEEPEIPFGD